MVGPSDVAAVLPTDLEEGLGDLLERTDARGIHEDGEDVLARRRRRLEARERRLGLVTVLGTERRHPGELALLLGLRGPGEHDLLGSSPAWGLRNVLTPTMGSDPSCFRCS